MIRFFKTPRIVQVRYPELIWKLKSDQSIYLTFDDGPDPNVTPWVMRELKNVNAKATFFCLGNNLKMHQSLATELIQEGHVIGNHTQNHLNGWLNTGERYHEDIRACDEELMKLGVNNKLFRPPYGRIRKSQVGRLKDRKIVMWSHLSWDFDKKVNIRKCLKKLGEADPGSILVFHDSAKAFANLKIILPEILAIFSQKGFKFEPIR